MRDGAATGERLEGRFYRSFDTAFFSTARAPLNMLAKL